MKSFFTLKPAEKHRLFFEFLLISPSYQLAHELVSDSVTVDYPSPPEDFDKVLNFYARCGSVFDITFEQWWEERGAELFLKSGDAARFITYRVDMSKSAQQQIREFNEFLKFQIEARKNKNASNSFNLISSKAHKKTLRTRISLVMDKAKRLSVGKPLTNWELAIFSGLESPHLKGLSFGMKLSEKNKAKRVYAGMWVSRLIKEAGVIAENAARGSYPNLVLGQSMLELDFKKIDFYAHEEMSKFILQQRKRRSQSKLSAKNFYRKQLPADIRSKLKIKELVDVNVELELRKIERDRRSSGEW